MDSKRLAWLDGIADRVPRPLDGIRAGSRDCAAVIGEREIDMAGACASTCTRG